jgi:hypothetical protein
VCSKNHLAVLVELQPTDVGVIVVRGKNIYCALCNKNTCKHAQYFLSLTCDTGNEYPPEVQQMLLAVKSVVPPSVLYAVEMAISQCRVDFDSSTALSALLRKLKEYTATSLIAFNSDGEKCQCEKSTVSASFKIMPLITSIDICSVKGKYNDDLS